MLCYLVAFSGLANVLLVGGVLLLYKGKRLASIVLGTGGAILTIRPLALGAEMVTAPCFLAWQGSMIMLVVAGLLSETPRDNDHRPPDNRFVEARVERPSAADIRRSPLWSADWQRDLEFSTSTASIGDGDPSGMCLYDPQHDR